MRNFREYDFWKDAVQLTINIYKICKEMPDYEQYGLISQMQRSSTSIASNIAEGSGRGTTKDFKHFLNIALGSAYELETQLIIAYNLNYIPYEYESLLSQLQSIQRRLAAF